MSKPKHSDALKEQTYKLLNKNYGLTFMGGEFYAIEFGDETTRLSKALFVSNAKMLIGEEAKELISEWFDTKKSEVTKKLLDYLDKLDDTASGSIVLSFNMLTHFENDPAISDEAVMTFFESHYVTNILPKVLKAEFAKLDPTTTKPEDFTEIKDFLFKTETENIYIIAKTKLNEWYSDSILGEAVADLFSQFVITLGSNSWKVTWIGHGPVTEDKILKAFRLDTDAHNEYILSKYQDWYDNAVIEASEREMNNAHNFELYNRIKKGELKLNTNFIDDLED